VRDVDEATRARIVESLRALRAELARLMREADAGAVHQALSQADMNLHWCQWQLGHVEDWWPEAAYPSPPTR
jgi:hypothetical protein